MAGRPVRARLTAELSLGRFSRPLAPLASAAVRRFSRETLVLLIALGLFNGSNYLFHVVVSRMLGPSSYGALAALLAIVMVLSVPFGVVQTVIAQRTAMFRAQGRDDEVEALALSTERGLVPLAWGAGILVLFGAPLLAVFLHLGFISAVLLAPYVVFSLLTAVPLGVLQGEQRFGALASLLLLGAAVRLATGISLVWAGLGVPGALLATAVSPLVVLLVGFGLLGLRGRRKRPVRPSLEHLRGRFATAFLGLTSFWLLAELDVALARHYLHGEDAGFYSSAGLLARALLFLPGAVALVAFPKFVAAREQGEGSERWLRISMAAVAVLMAVGLPLLIILRGPLVFIAFGDQFDEAAHVLPVLGVAMALMAAVGLLVYFHIAMASRGYWIIFGGVLLEVVLVALFHDTPEQVAFAVAAVSALVAVALYVSATSLARWRPPFERFASSPEALARLSAEASVELTLVLPCHNAGPGLRKVLKDLLRAVDHVESFEIIVVSDGSTDETVSVCEQFAPEVRVLHYADRGGKGHALRIGLTEAKGAYVAFLDADGDIDADAIRPFLAVMKLYEPDVVLGSKRHPLSQVYYPPVRRLLSWTYHKLTRLLFRVNVRDTQTGLKLIRREVLAAVLPRLLEKRYAFDLEFLVVARVLGYKRVFEAPVRIDYRFSSQVNPRSAFRIGLDTLAIFYRHYLLDSYRRGAEQVGVDEPHAATVPMTNGSPLPAIPAPVDGDQRRLRLLFLNWRDIRNPDAGGAEVVTHEVAKRWVENGHDVTVLTSRFSGAPDAETIDGVHVRRLGRLRTGSFHLLVQKELANLRGFDLVIDEINTAPFLTPLWRRRLPPVLALIHQLANDVLDSELPKPIAAAGRALESRALRLYQDVPVVTVSESTKRDLEHLGIRNVSVIADGCDDPPDLGDVDKEPVPTFLFAGRLAANKRPDHAVDAFRCIRRLLPNARLWVVGQGPLEQPLRRALPSGAELLGFLPRDELYQRMARAHCLLVPSVREGWGLVVIEANSVGTPAVGYDVPGLRDSIRNGATGLLARPGDPAELARQALSLIADEQRYGTMSQAAAEWASQFSWDQMARDLLGVVDALARPPVGARAGNGIAIKPARRHYEAEVPR
jgi:glycosyltransferase involved in cell wall biosynthesis/O-antigen/teichoic acid export membrane protein